MGQIRIAVIDDASMIRDLVKKFVRQNFPEAQIFEANNGKLGAQLLKRQPVDLILCDWEMPEMDGKELLEWVRRQDALKQTPFIMVTSRGDKEFVLDAIESGVSDYLVKPFNNLQFIEKITKALKRHGLDIEALKKTTSKIQSGGGGDSLAVLTGHSKPREENKKSGRILPKGIAIIRVPNGEITCALKSLDLKSMIGVAMNNGFIPGLLEQTSLDIEFESGEKQTLRINGFITALKASEDRFDSSKFEIKVVFSDEDPQKMKLLSDYITNFN